MTRSTLFYCLAAVASYAGSSVIGSLDLPFVQYFVGTALLWLAGGLAWAASE